jgi:hypothetical protein
MKEILLKCDQSEVEMSEREREEEEGAWIYHRKVS